MELPSAEPTNENCEDVKIVCDGSPSPTVTNASSSGKGKGGGSKGDGKGGKAGKGGKPGRKARESTKGSKGGPKRGKSGKGEGRRVPVCTLNEKYGEFVTQCVDLDSLQKGSKKSLGKYNAFIECGCCAEELGEADPPEYCLAA